MGQTFIKRPTSPLNSEPLEVAHEDILCYGSDDELDSDEREKRKVRIEDLGKQYLEGRPLYILSAGLRGPFDNGWINPWTRNGKKNGANTTRMAIIDNKTEPQVVSPLAKRKSVLDEPINPPRYQAINSEMWEEPRAKRMRHEDSIRPKGTNVPDAQWRSTIDERDNIQATWLKRNIETSYPSSREGLAPSSPTPVVRQPSKTSPSLRKYKSTQSTSNESLKARKPREVIPIPGSGPPSFDEIPRSKELEGCRHSKKDLFPSPAPTNTDRSSEILGIKRGHVFPSEHNSPAKRSRTMADEQPQNFAFQGVTTKEGPSKSQGPSAYTPSQVPQDIEKPTPSRLAPYVSDVVMDEAATSAGLKAVSKGSKPSPRVVPSSSNLPKFQYRYTRKETSPPVFRSNAKHEKPQTRPRAISISSSGSSDFAEAFEAAQAKANFPSMSSFESSPIKQRPETKSIKKNTQAMRRLTFSFSGEPKVNGLGKTSRPNSSSSAAVASITNQQDSKSEHQMSGKGAASRKASARSSELATNGNPSRSSMILPEAQILSEAPAQLARLPSGPSTDLMQTYEQSPKFISLDEDDSYLDLSTQAAMMKAQRAFQTDALSPLIVKKEAKLDWGGITPRTNGHLQQVAGRSVVKPEPRLEESIMSTQAIADAISPFAVTTIKKRPPSMKKKRTNFTTPLNGNISPTPAPLLHPEPSPIFKKPLSMATTPSNSQPKPSPPVPLSQPKTTSKPPSSATSLSMLPNGTLPESSNLQDGQQQPQQHYDVSLPLDAFESPLATTSENRNQRAGSWDQDAAIEEAESFLGEWNIEAVTKKDGNVNKRGDAGLKSILAHPK